MMENSNINYLLPKYEDYVDCMVAFVDVLGFDSKVRNIKSKEDFLNVSGLLFALKEEVDHIFNYLVEDSCDGYYFIDYLNPNGFPEGMLRERLIEERKKIEVFIEKCLKSHNGNMKIFSKYKWLANYFSLTEHCFDNIKMSLLK